MPKNVACVAILWLGCLFQAWPQQSPQDNTTTPQDSNNSSQASDANVFYVIGPEDVLSLFVWKEPELSITVPVRTDGKISVPLLNDVQAAGLTPSALAGSLTDKLKKYFDDPRVTVIVTQMNHQKIYIVGQVLRHGQMTLSPNMTVLQALASAGLNQFASTKKIYVLRLVNGVEQKLSVNYKKLLKGEATSQNIQLQAGDTIVVP